MLRGLAIVAVAACLAACFSSATTTCGDVVCPPDKTCSPDGTSCVLEVQITACDNLQDNDACTFGQASGGCSHHVCVPAGCGNHVLEPGEACDDGNVVSGDGCSADCKSTEACGNAIVDVREACDCGDGSQPAASLPQACQGKPNSDDPGAFCRPTCLLAGCGDGIHDPIEECEGADVGGKTCQDLGYYHGTLACTPSCTFDRTSCSGKCGDNVLDPEEQCDGTSLGGANCTALGYYGTGGLGCNSACVFDPAGCTGGKCGDGAVNGPEPCDGPGPTGITCQDLGYHAGAGVTCTSLCTLDESQCSETCGDGTRQDPEDCDGTDLGGVTCADLGWHGGTLTCRPFCSFDTDACTGKCGDGNVDTGEVCDGSVGSHTCSEFGFSQPGGLGCTLCSFDTTDCMGYCGDGYLQSLESCDAPSFGGRTCLDAGFDAGRLDCSVLCGDQHDDCSSFAWDLLKADSITAAWSNGSVAFFAGGPSGTVYRYDGTTWTQWAVSGTTGSPAIWGLSPTDVYVVSGTGVVHFNGTTWGNVGGYTGLGVNAVDAWGSGPSDLFVIDGEGGIAHWNGTAWTTIYVNVYLAAIWGTSATNVYAVGGGSNSLTSGIQHFDGTAWSAVTSPLSIVTQFQGIWGTSATDIYLSTDTGVIVHYDGVNWTPMTPIGASGQIAGHVWGKGANDVYIDGSILQHWDGASWTNSVLPANATTTVSLGADLLTGSSTGIYRGGHTSWRTTAIAPPSYFEAVWESSASVVHIAAEFSDEMILANSAWSTQPIRAGQELRSMWGMGQSDIWAGGDTAIYHYDGTAWTLSFQVPQPVYSISGTSSTNVYAVDLQGNAHHYTGSWSSTSVISGSSLYGVFATPTETFAVGGIGQIFHVTTGQWKAMTSPTTRGLLGVWGTSNTNVWAVGTGGTIIHYDGTAWTASTSGVTDDLYSVWGSGASNVYAVGLNGTIAHFDGTGWTRVMTRAGLSFRSVHGASASDVWAVGLDTNNKLGTVVHYDGTTWTQVLPRLGAINATYGTGVGAIAVGNSGSALRYEGSMWLPLVSGTTRDLRGLAGASTSDVTAVGAAGTITHWNGTAWSSVTSGTSADLNAIWNGYIVGAGGTILHGSGSSWSAMTSGTTQDLLAVWGSSATDVYAVGRAGTLLHGNGTSWTALASGTKNDLFAISGSSANNIFAVGDRGAVARWDGTAWRTSWSGTPQTLDAVYVGGPADVLAGSSSGEMLFFDGAHWTTIRTTLPTSEHITSFAGTQALLTYGGSQGTIGGLARPITCTGTDVCGDRWDNDCDGLADASDSDCTPPPAEQCSNGIDDDRDGLTDCEDPDCVGNTYCVRGGVCQARYVIKCGDTVMGTTAASPKLDDYPCAPRGEGGGEANYKLLLTTPATVTATVSSATSLDVIAVGATATGGCEPWTECYAGGTGSVTFSAPAGASFIVIDAPSAVSASFSLTVTCP